MKLALFGEDYKLGVVNGDQIVDVSDAVKDIPHIHPGDLMNGLIENWDAYKGKVADAAAKGKGVALSSVRLRPPLPRPTNIVCMAVNYMENGTLPEKPPINAFHKSPTGIIGDGDTMVLPDIPATIFEGEAEMALVIGKKATNVAEADYKQYIFGFMNFIDGSARGLTPGFYAMKARETFAPMGPIIVTADEVPDPENLHVQLWNNGQLMQDYMTSDMAHKIPECISWVSHTHTLLPGDMIALGTNHRGLNPFMDGDKIELEVEGMGRLHINVRDDLKRRWKRETRLQRLEQGFKTSPYMGEITPQISGKYAKA